MQVSVLLFKNTSGDNAYVVDVFSSEPTEEEIKQAMERIYASGSGDHWIETKDLIQANIATLISDGDSTHALYINGKLIEDGSDTNVNSILEHYKIEWNYPAVDQDWLEEVLYETGIWPEDLKDVVLYKG